MKPSNFSSKILQLHSSVTVLQITLFTGAVALERDENGQLQATDSQMDMTCKQIIIDLQNSGMAALTDGLGPFMFQVRIDSHSIVLWTIPEKTFTP